VSSSKFQHMDKDQLIAELERFLFMESIYQEAENIAQVGYYEWDLKADRLASCSEGYANIFNMSKEAIMQAEKNKGSTIAQIHPDDQERYLKVWDGLSITQSLSIEYRIVRSDGEIVHLREVGVLSYSMNGANESSFGIIQDITAQKLIEAELTEAKVTLELQVRNRTRELVETVLKLKQEAREREKIAKELKYLANHDPLTGLPSLRLCKDRLEQAIREFYRHKLKAAVLFIDLDGFKEVNDVHGHDAGDRVLQITANRIKKEVRQYDTVARVGGDEFLVILSRVPNMDVPARICSQLIKNLSHGISLAEHQVSIGASIGVAIFPDDADNSEQLIKQADNAMYRAKNSGKNKFLFVHEANNELPENL